MESERESTEHGEPEGSLSILRRYQGSAGYDYALYRLYNAWRLDAKPRSQGGRGYYIHRGHYVLTDPIKLALCDGHDKRWRLVGSDHSICGICHPPAPGLELEWL